MRKLRIRHHTAFLLAARVISAATTLALLSYLGHARGGDALGVVAVGLAFGALLSAISDAGTASLLVREAARDERQLDRLLGAMTLWRIVVLPAALLGLWIVLDATVSTEPLAVLLVAAGLGVQQWAELTRAVFLARQEMQVSSAHSAVENLIWLAVTVGLLAGGAELSTAFLAGLLVFVTSTLFGYALVAIRGGVIPAVPGWDYIRPLAYQLRPFAAFVVVGVAYARIDTILVGALLPVGGLVAAGAYFSTMRLLAGLEYIPEAVARAIYPGLAAAFATDPTALGRKLRPAAAFLVAISVPIPFVMLVAGGWLMTSVFGADVGAYAWLVVPLSAVIPLRFLGHLFGMALTSSDAQGRRVIAVIAALALVIAVDVVLIPRIGVAGAVIGSVAASIIVFLVYAAEVHRQAGGLGIGSVLVRCLIVALVVTAGGLVAEPFGGPAVALGMLVAYGAILALLRAAVRVPQPSMDVGGGTGS
jgi:O-antigen/teichoic acid export membrane protein